MKAKEEEAQAVVPPARARVPEQGVGFSQGLGEEGSGGSIEQRRPLAPPPPNSDGGRAPKNTLKK